ncbi:MAG: IS21 family transposase [Pseudonocardiaceae bacterium]
MAGRVELFEGIRRDHRREQLSVRALAERHGVHRRTVRAALASAVPPARKSSPRAAPAIGPWTGVIDTWLVGDKDVPRKQRHTARRIWQRLGAEHGAVLCEVTVSRYVRRRRVELGLADGIEVMVAQSHDLGAEGEVDFGEFYAEIAGVMTKCHLFLLRLSASAKGVSIAFTNQGQEAFLEGHVRAFERLGGVPGRVRYDNLKSAVVRVLKGRGREESERFIALRSHYGFDSFFCRPGLVGSHEKGGVEGEIGRFRRRHLVPVPKVTSLTELNDLLAAADAIDNARHLPGRRGDIGTAFAAEQPTLSPLPVEPFETGLTLHPRVDRHARITVRCCHYSVPASLVGRRVRVLLRASDLVVLDDRREVARHERSSRKGSTTLVLDHYLEVLRRKPGALPGATALVQARESGTFTTEHEAFWAAARRAHGDAAGTRELVEVLLLHRRQAPADVIAGIAAALGAGAVRADVVAVEVRRLAQARSGAIDTPGAPAGSQAGRVVSLTERRLTDPAAVIAGLPPDTRPLPQVTAYDELLPRRAAAAPAGSASSEVS